MTFENQLKKSILQQAVQKTIDAKNNNNNKLPYGFMKNLVISVQNVVPSITRDSINNEIRRQKGCSSVHSLSSSLTSNPHSNHNVMGNCNTTNHPTNHHQSTTNTSNNEQENNNTINSSSSSPSHYRKKEVDL